ncbi:hypothetical protein [uncultured Roseovarius sp.]|uniref:hypothetical protein n=1 Tax=uncultured Roseovarius sp. TaxID=293344 RepID=UPI0026074ED2|nr:hypothetical protein [uncultured Roseovarius sp.]
MKTRNLGAITIFAFGLAGCAAGPSPTLAKYSDAQINRCYNSLSYKDRQAAQAKAQQVAYIPIAGALMFEEQLYKEYEKICKRKGILR